MPAAVDVNRYASEPYAPRLINQMEILVLMRLNWSLTSTTALHFLGFFHCKGVLFAGDAMAYRPLVPDVVRYFKRYTDFFADFSLQGAFVLANCWRGSHARGGVKTEQPGVAGVAFILMLRSLYRICVHSKRYSRAASHRPSPPRAQPNPFLRRSRRVQVSAVPAVAARGGDRAGRTALARDSVRQAAGGGARNGGDTACARAHQPDSRLSRRRTTSTHPVLILFSSLSSAFLPACVPACASFFMRSAARCGAPRSKRLQASPRPR